MTDRQLLEAYAVRADLAAFDQFVSRHQQSLLSFAASVLRDETSAQDVVQEAFLRAALHPQRILENAAATERNWLLKVVRDLSVDSLRRRATERKSLTDVSKRPRAEAVAPDQQMEAREREAAVRAAIDRLKPRHRELLLLKIREKKTYKEIAQITGLSVTNVGFLLHQAMQMLSQDLQQCEGTPAAARQPAPRA